MPLRSQVPLPERVKLVWENQEQVNQGPLVRRLGWVSASVSRRWPAAEVPPGGARLALPGPWPVAAVESPASRRWMPQGGEQVARLVPGRLAKGLAKPEVARLGPAP